MHPYCLTFKFMLCNQKPVLLGANLLKAVKSFGAIINTGVLIFTTSEA